MENTENKVMFENNLKELESVVKQLESGDVTLDEMLGLFERGIKLTRGCTAALDEAEQKISILMRNRETGEMEEQPFGSSGIQE
ncbi:MAG: exodeoxyribonuclease VII small subunit [Clostridiales bacterium]|nr:exodeoxyribonuclease VII small subunit [Clostridiales bacterium]